MTCGGYFAFDSVSEKLVNRGCASRSLLFLGVSALGVLIAHLLALALWRALPWTKERPLPDFLVFPVPELLVAGLLVMPLGTASATLVMQAGDVGGQALGALAGALLLAYLGLVGAVLLGVSARRELLGLRYVPHPRAARRDPQDPTDCPPLSSIQEDGTRPALVAVESTATRGSTADAQQSARSSVRSLLLRVSPPHSAGYWERPDVVLQQELRRSYQSGSAVAAILKRLHLSIDCAPGSARQVVMCVPLQVESAPRCGWCPASSVCARVGSRC
jgi:hypothetical protein